MRLEAYSMCSHTALCAYRPTPHTNIKTHSLQCLQAQTHSKASDPALELYLPHCHSISCHTQRKIGEEKSGKQFFCLCYLQTFYLSVTSTKHKRANRKSFVFQSKRSSTYNQCGGDGMEDSAWWGKLLTAKCEAIAHCRLLYIIEEVSKVKRLRWSFHIMTAVPPSHCQHNEDVTWQWQSTWWWVRWHSLLNTYNVIHQTGTPENSAFWL